MVQMGDGCMRTSGVLATLGGLSFLGFGLGMLDGSTSHLASGVLFTLFGLGMLYHSENMCSNCKAAMGKRK